MRADLIIVTEPGPGFRERHQLAHLSPEQRASRTGREAWVGICGPALKSVSLDIDYRHLAVASRAVLDETKVVIYGSVLPWVSARMHAPDVYGESKQSFIEIFESAMSEQVADMLELRSRYPDHSLVWAGDFNHTLTGRPLSRRASELLRNAIDELDLAAVNASSPHRMEGMSSLDLICVDKAWTCETVDSGYPLLGGRPLSDHRWYVAQVSP